VHAKRFLEYSAGLANPTVMRSARSLLLKISCFTLLATAVLAQGTCDLPQLQHQQRDAATLQRLDTAWSVAYLRGDTNFERCLLTPDFGEFLRNGQHKVLADELASAAKNRGKNLPIPVLPKLTVLIDGNVAVLYATTRFVGADGKTLISRNVDYYVWRGGSWHAFFSQQTPVEASQR